MLARYRYMHDIQVRQTTGIKSQTIKERITVMQKLMHMHEYRRLSQYCEDWLLYNIGRGNVRCRHWRFHRQHRHAETLVGRRTLTIVRSVLVVADAGTTGWRQRAHTETCNKESSSWNNGMMKIIESARDILHVVALPSLKLVMRNNGSTSTCAWQTCCVQENINSTPPHKPSLLTFPLAISNMCGNTSFNSFSYLQYQQSTLFITNYCQF